MTTNLPTLRPLDLYEDFFQYICRLNRAAAGRPDHHPNMQVVRLDIKTLLEEVQRKTANDARLRQQARQLELPMIFFADSVISNSKLSFANEWSAARIAFERNEMAGDQDFFIKYLDVDLKTMTEDASERVAVYYTCLGLGFEGMYFGQRAEINKYLSNILPRIGQWMDRDTNGRLCQEAYESTDRRILTEPPSKMIVFVAILFVFLGLSSLAIYYGLYAKASEDLTASVRQINQHASGRQSATAPPAAAPAPTPPK
jgi:type VI secretion system protein ImpK